MDKLLACPPSVFAVEDEYQICALVGAECTMRVEVGGRTYFDHSNGILRSGRFLHIARVPLKALERARGYAVVLERIRERKPYFTDYGETERAEFAFRPVGTKAKVNVINLADAHGLVAEPIASGSYFGDKLDLLVLNGDIPDHSGDRANFRAIYQIAGGITGGRVPCVFSRGNHDMRGIYAEQLADYTPTADGRSYFTFRTGPVWGIVLDAGEDKPDGNPEYGHTICCAAFRREQEAFIDKVMKEKAWRDAPIRLIVSHHPFAYKIPHPFDIEQELYARWCRKLRPLKAAAWLTGHLHDCFAELPGDAHDSYGFPCPVICSSNLKRGGDDGAWHVAGAITFDRDGDFSVSFPDSRDQARGRPG